MNNVAAFGEETAAHPSVSQEQKKNIEQSIVTIKNEWDRLNEKINWRIARYVDFNLLTMSCFVYGEWHFAYKSIMTCMLSQYRS